MYKYFGRSPFACSFSRVTAACCVLCSVNAQAQTPQTKAAVHRSIDISAGILGQLTETRSPTDTETSFGSSVTTQKLQSSSPSAGVLATVHQNIFPRVGYNVNFGWTRLQQNYATTQQFIYATQNSMTVTSTTTSQLGVKSDVYELSVAPVLEGPSSRKLRTFAQVGGGGLFFVPGAVSGSPGALPRGPFRPNQQTRPALVFGAGVEYKISPRLSVRAEYRGLFYKGPDFAYDSRAPIQRLFTVTSQPAVSMVYRFGQKR